MALLPDWVIRERAYSSGMISPFKDYHPKEPGTISSGLTSAGYDLTLARRFKIFTNVTCAVVDPKFFDPTSLVDWEGDHCLIPPNSYALAESVEHVSMPKDCMGIILGKSTYARCGVIVNCTPIEPGWRGRITIEIANTTPLPAKIYAGEGIGQLLFFKLDSVCERTYETKPGGKYQDQEGLTLPRV